ncbi:hypothetical protein P879_02028 [Paragonimus westermani]|uniref:Son of sevenless n=1 Tax=Paragonimus westermani TaxID=34504 RepID=A0A8T0DYB5_9TREM|nr:hypothetical protein P879_02028 [Paragonimus westermani]
MATAISRHTSTVSLVSQSSVQVEAGLLVQCLSRHKDVLESGCERVLELKCLELLKKGTSLDGCDLSGCTTSPIPFVSRSPSRTGVTNSPSSLTFRRFDAKAREALGQHLIELLATIVLPDPPQSIKEVDIKLAGGLPGIPDKMMPKDLDGETFRTVAIKKRKSSLHLPIKEIHAAFKEFNDRFSFTVSMYIVAVAEHIIGKFLQTLFQIYRDRIQTRRKGLEPKLTHKFPQDYDKCVDELDVFLHTTLEQMNLLLRVFRDPMLTCCSDEQHQEDSAHGIFRSILDLYSNMRIFMDTLNAEEEDIFPPVGKSAGQSVVSSRPLSGMIEIQTELSAESVTSPELSNPVPTTAGDVIPTGLPTTNLGEPGAQAISYAAHSGPRRRLVGIGLIELAEDDSLHAFSQYASIVLDPVSRDRVWSLIENGSLIQALCRLSRTILHTASLSKLSNTANSSTPVMGNTRNRWTDLHSFVCKRCRYWDSVPAPRRRSTSSIGLRLSTGSSPTRDSSTANAGGTKTKLNANKHHRNSHSSSSTEVWSSSANCNYLVNAFKYLLPRLLLLPVFQFFYLHELIKTLHQCAYDDDDRARLKEVLSMLSKTRSSLERDISKHPWVCLQMSRLISTGHLTGQYRLLYLDLLTGSNSLPSPICGTNPPSPTSPLVQNGLTSQTNSPTNVAAHGSQLFGFSASSSDPVGYGPLGTKADEIERLLGGKEKLTTTVLGRQCLGDFVMEGRVSLITETKRPSSAEHVAYLFTGLLLICKWHERRATLNPNSGSIPVLRVKYRIPADLLHLTDLPPVIQPNLSAHVGSSGTITSSAVGAAVWAATAANHGSAQSSGTTGFSHTDFSNFFASNLNSGSVASQSSLSSVGVPPVTTTFPYMFELEYLDCSQLTSMSSAMSGGMPASSHRTHCPHYQHQHTRHISPQKLTGTSVAYNPSQPVEASLYPTASLGSPNPVTVDSNNNNACLCLPPGVQVHHITLAFRTPEEKADWTASLLSVQVHRLFLRYIRTLPKIEVPLRLPSPSIYRFTQPDTPDSIVFETSPTPDSSTDSVYDVPDSVDSSEERFEDEDCVATDSENYLDDATTAPVAYRSGAASPVCRSQETFSSSALGDFTTAYSAPDEDETGSGTLTANAIVRPCPDSSTPSTVTHTSNTITPPSIHVPATPNSTSMSGAYPQIRMATLDKLIERLTYPTYFDVRLANTFLLLYRRVTTPERLLELLIERFRIPDPEFLPEELDFDMDKGQLESPAQHMLKRFRSGYKKRVQARVLMILSRWVRSNRYYQYDFGPRPDLRHRLSEFLASIQARHLITSVRRIQHHLQTNSTAGLCSGEESEFEQFTSSVGGVQTSPRSAPEASGLGRTDSSPTLTPASLTVAETPVKTFSLDIANIHPYKLAEQVTLYEWELYRAIQFWEVEGRDRGGHSTPNLDRSKRFSNRFRNWLVYAILCEPHPDDRVVAIQRVIDLMLIMEKMNNLQGSQEAKSALISAAVFRLHKSFNTIRRFRHYREVVDRLRRENTGSTAGSKMRSKHSTTTTQGINIAQSLTGHGIPTLSGNSSSHDRGRVGTGSSQLVLNNVLGLPFVSRAHERRIRALEKQHVSGDACHPCVPFIASGVMTRLIHLDLCQADTITTESGTVLINCWKYRQLAEVVERYLAFQRIPYLFTVNHIIRDLLEKLDPLELAGVSSEVNFESRIIFTPSHSLSRVGCKTEFKSPQSLSPPLFSKPGHGDFREEDPCPSRQHLPVPSSIINASSHDGSSFGGVHQHSMSDSLIHSSPRRSGSHATSALHSHHHTTHSAVAEFTGPRSLGLSPPPTPPHSAGPETSPGSVHPPPLPPRKSTSGKSGPSSTSVAVPPQPAVIGVAATHSVHSKPPHGPLPSESISDKPPPPLPPKMPTRIVTNRSGMTGSSPQPTLGQTFAFDSEALYSVRMTDCPPPLPPRRACPTPMTHNIRPLVPELTTTTIPPA